MGTAKWTNNVKVAKIQEYANMGNVHVEMDIFYIIWNVLKVGIIFLIYIFNIYIYHYCNYKNRVL